MNLKLFLLLLTTTLATAQQEASVWYFGNYAGVKFDAVGNVTALTDGQLSTARVVPQLLIVMVICCFILMV